MTLNINSNGYVMGFAVAVCVVISAMLAVTANALDPFKKAALEFDRQKNVMIAAGMVKPGDPRSPKEMRELYKQRVQEKVLDLQKGTFREELSLAETKDAARDKKWRTVAVAMRADGKSIDCYVFPVSGLGLWSTLYGFLALEADGAHVRGITFYKHGETPGLGGECENPEWTAKWVGKSILDDAGKLVSIKVKKGKVDPTIPAEKAHMVDGLSGSTITSNGITKFVQADLSAYAPFLQQFWAKKQ